MSILIHNLGISEFLSPEPFGVGLRTFNRYVAIGWSGYVERSYQLETFWGAVLAFKPKATTETQALTNCLNCSSKKLSGHRNVL